MLKIFERNQVTILPGLFLDRMQKNKEYLMELDSVCLLQNFYLEAGIILPGLQVVDNPASAKLHWGWEAPTCQLRGHFLGHWLSASAALVASNGDEGLTAKLNYIVSELARCQQLNGGEWIGSIPEKYFIMLERGSYVWSPQYTMHKTLMGLTHVYMYTGNDDALAVVDKLAEWYVRWVKRCEEVNPSAVYSGEQAGMLEIWALLYELTGNGKYMGLAKAYAEQGMFRVLEKGGDALSDDHANASIPLSHGAAKMYEVTGDDRWRELTEKFWQSAVEERGMYCTGGQNAGEFWIPPHELASHLCDRNQEFCTVYNMVRTASYLYRWTGNGVYADYIERCLYNGFLAQQNSETGMPAYFLPLRAGSRKKWGSKRLDFWCCHGTMVQAQTLYPELVWHKDGQGITVSQYIPSVLTFEQNGNPVRIELNQNMKNYNTQLFFDEHGEEQSARWSYRILVHAGKEEVFSLSFRVPSWVEKMPELLVNGEQVKTEYIMNRENVAKDEFLACAVKDGDESGNNESGSNGTHKANRYMRITRSWCEDKVTLSFPCELHTEALSDAPELTAIMDGPVVLAGMTEKDGGIYGDINGHNGVLMPLKEHIYTSSPWKESHYLTRRQPENFEFMPLYEVQDERYTVYFTKKKDDEV